MEAHCLNTLANDDLDLSTLTPGIREVVRLLRQNGFKTTDSGDGVTNVANGMEGAMTVPHVVMRIEPDEIIAEARRLQSLIDPYCTEEGASGPFIEASFSPRDNIAVLVLFELSDADLNA